jgi:hypothetical protein
MLAREELDGLRSPIAPHTEFVTVPHTEVLLPVRVTDVNEIVALLS